MGTKKRKKDPSEREKVLGIQSACGQGGTKRIGAMSACGCVHRIPTRNSSADRASHSVGLCKRPLAIARHSLVSLRDRHCGPIALAQPAAGSLAAAPSFEQLYSQLAGVLAAPGSLVEAAPTTLGRGLVPMQAVDKGATLLSVDYFNMLCVTDDPGRTGNAFGRRVLEDWQLLHGRLPPLLNRYLLSDEGDWFVRLVAWLLWLKKNATGPWRLYIDLLPEEGEMSCLMNYREGEVSELQSPLLESRARLERQQISGLHDRLFSSTGGELKALQLADSLDDTVWAACMVNSRCFSDTISGETVSLMVPCADMANHVLAPNTAYQFKPEADAFQLTALQGIAAGSEACISYGCTHKNSEALMRDYGFVIPGNLNDRVPFSAGDDVASQLAAAAAGGSSSAPRQRPSLSAPRLLSVLGLAPDSGPSGFNLTAAAAAAMGDSKGDAEKRRLLATLMSLQPFLRDIPAAGGRSSSSGGAATGAAASSAAAAPLAPLSEAELQRERQSADALAAQCRAALAALPTSAESDAALLAAELAGSREPLGARLQAAVAARLESKRLLAAAESALTAYRASLA